MRRPLLPLALLALVTACESTPPAVAPRSEPTVKPPVAVVVPPPAPTETPDADFRQKAPAPSGTVAFVAPTVVEGKLANGIRVLMVERHELPVVAVRVVATRGAAQGRPGIGSFTAATLQAGTSKHNADELSDAFEALGAEHWASADYDGVQVGIKVVADQLPTALDLLAEVVQTPTFPKNEVDLERGRRLASLAQERDRPGALLGRAVSGLLYPPSHPYAVPTMGDEAAVEKITRVDLATFHRAQFEPDRLTVVAAGDFKRDTLLAALDKTLGTMKGKADKAREVKAPPPGKEGPRVVIVDRPGASQSNVALAAVGVPRVSPDYEAILLMNTILGGQFSSRLNLNLREKNGFTYGAGSSFAMRQGPGPFSTSGAIVREHTAAAVREYLGEIDTMRTTLVTEAELNDARELLIRQLQAYFESTDELTSLLSTIAIQGLPVDEFTRRPDKLRQVTPADIQRVAKQYVVPDRLRVVIVGDAAAIQPGLDALKLGKTEVRRTPASKKPSDPARADNAAKKPVDAKPNAPSKKPDASSNKKK